MTDKKLMPQIRFKGFSGAWEQRKLGEIVKFVGGGTPSKSNPDFWNGNIVWLSSKEIKQQFISHGTYTITQKAVNQSATTLVEKDTPLIVYRSGILIHTFPIARPTQQVAINQDIKALLFDHSKIEVQFLVSQLEGQEKFILQNIVKSGTTVQSINMPDLVKLHFWITTLNEQKKIGVLFKQLDSTIALHQLKLDKLELLKKGFLQQLFPSNGQKVPVIRFADFTADWEQRKLGEIADIVGGGTPSTAKPEYWNGNIDWYAPAEIGKQRYVSKSIKQITEAGLSNSSAKILPIGTVLFTSRAGIGNTAILTKIGTTNQGFQSIVPKIDLIDSYFIYAKTADLKRYGERTGAGSTFVEVSGKQMSIMPINLPTLIEQKKIGGFFKKADDTIAFHQQRLNALKQLKESLLQKLFV